MAPKAEDAGVAADANANALVAGAEAEEAAAEDCPNIPPPGETPKEGAAAEVEVAAAEEAAAAPKEAVGAAPKSVGGVEEGGGAAAAGVVVIAALLLPSFPANCALAAAN